MTPFGIDRDPAIIYRGSSAPPESSFEEDPPEDRLENASRSESNVQVNRSRRTDSVIRSIGSSGLCPASSERILFANASMSRDDLYRTPSLFRKRSRRVNDLLCEADVRSPSSGNLARIGIVDPLGDSIDGTHQNPSTRRHRTPRRIVAVPAVSVMVRK